MPENAGQALHERSTSTIHGLGRPCTGETGIRACIECSVNYSAPSAIQYSGVDACFLYCARQEAELKPALTYSRRVQKAGVRPAVRNEVQETMLVSFTLPLGSFARVLKHHTLCE